MFVLMVHRLYRKRVRLSHTSQQNQKRRDKDRLYNYEADLDQYADDAYYYNKFLQTLKH